MKTTKPVDLHLFKDAIAIARTGKDLKGHKYSTEGKLNAAAWAGENCGCLIAEIESLRSQLDACRIKKEDI